MFGASRCAFHAEYAAPLPAPPSSSASGACLTGRRTGIPPACVEDYVMQRGRSAWLRHERLHHDIEVAERATGAFAFGVLIAAFIVIGAGTAIYDIGKWLAIW